MTPPELAELMLDLAGDKTSRLLDPACGSGTILLAAARRGYTRVEGQEQDGSLTLVTALRLALARTASFDVHAGDSLKADAYRRPSAEAVVCNPPFADRNWGLEKLAHDPRWVYEVPPRLESELAWVQHALAHVVPGALHGLVAAEARRNDLSEPEAVDLVRRAEVVIGAVSARHLRLDENAHRALRRPHSMDLIAPKVNGGINIGALAAPKVYAHPKCLERRRQPTPPPGRTLALSRAYLAGNRHAWEVRATGVSAMRVPFASRLH